MDSFELRTKDKNKTLIICPKYEVVKSLLSSALYNTGSFYVKDNTYKMFKKHD